MISRIVFEYFHSAFISVILVKSCFETWE